MTTSWVGGSIYEHGSTPCEGSCFPTLFASGQAGNCRSGNGEVPLTVLNKPEGSNFEFEGYPVQLQVFLLLSKAVSVDGSHLSCNLGFKTGGNSCFGSTNITWFISPPAIILPLRWHQKTRTNLNMNVKLFHRNAEESWTSLWGVRKKIFPTALQVLQFRSQIHVY